MSQTLPTTAAMRAPVDVAAAPAICFQVRHHTHKIACAVSAEALEDASGLPPESSEQMHRRSFDRFRTLIEAAAQYRLSALPPSFCGPITLTAQDLRRVPHVVGMPSYAQLPRRETRS
jgi:hypothetical protein